MNPLVAEAVALQSLARGEGCRTTHRVQDWLVVEGIIVRQGQVTVVSRSSKN